MLSILIPTIGRPDTIIRAIDSALRVDLTLVTEVVVLDNSQDTDFGRFLNDFISNADDKRLKVISYPDRKSMSESWNSGLDCVSNKWVLYLHDDDELLDINKDIDVISRDLAHAPDVGFISYDYILSTPFNVLKKTRLAKVSRKVAEGDKGNVISIINDCPKFISTIINAEKLQAIGGWQAEYGYFLDLMGFVELNNRFGCEFRKLFVGIYYIHPDNYSSIERRNKGYGDYIPVLCDVIFARYSDVSVRKAFLRLSVNFVYPAETSILKGLFFDFKFFMKKLMVFGWN